MATSVDFRAATRRILAGSRGALALVAMLVTASALVLAQPAAAQGLFGGGRDAGDDQRNADMVVRINQLEGQMRSLNGQIEQIGRAHV